MLNKQTFFLIKNTLYYSVLIILIFLLLCDSTAFSIASSVVYCWYKVQLVTLPQKRTYSVSSFASTSSVGAIKSDAFE